MSPDDSCQDDKEKKEPVLQYVTTYDNRSSKLPRGPWSTRENHWIAMANLLITCNKCKEINTREVGELFKETCQRNKGMYHSNYK